MTYRFGLMMVALGTVLASCADPLLEAADGDIEGTDETEGSGMGNVTEATPGVDGGGDGADETTTTDQDPSDDWAEGTSGGIEEGTGFGMSDDMPLAVAIPDIREGQVPVGTWVLIEQVPATTGRAILGSDEWLYVQDPDAVAHMGLRVELDPGAALPATDRWLDLVGYVEHDARGWALELDVTTQGTQHDGVEPLLVTLATLDAVVERELDDALVEVVGPLEVAAYGFQSGTVRVHSGERSLTIDLRPFDLEDVQLWPGMQLEHVVGVVEIGDTNHAVLLPRTPDDIVILG